jgi:C4-dicarboxylate-specific signal transduction histidine kinase
MLNTQSFKLYNLFNLAKSGIVPYYHCQYQQLIEDNGIGMSEDIKLKIFDPFFTTKGVGQGMGLGLTIAYDTLKKYGAVIDVESIVGFWTKFRIIV